MSILDRFESETFGPVLGPNFELFIIFGALEEFERLATRRLLSIPGAGSGGGWRWMAVDGGGWWRLVVDGGGWWWMVVDGGGGGLAESDSVCHCRCYPCCPCHSCGPFSLVDISLSLSCTSYSWGTLGVAVLSISPFSIVWFVVEEALVVSFQDKDK